MIRTHLLDILVTSRYNLHNIQCPFFGRITSDQADDDDAFDEFSSMRISTFPNIVCVTYAHSIYIPAQNAIHSRQVPSRKSRNFLNTSHDSIHSYPLISHHLLRHPFRKTNIQKNHLLNFWYFALEKWSDSSLRTSHLNDICSENFLSTYSEIFRTFHVTLHFWLKPLCSWKTSVYFCFCHVTSLVMLRRLWR